MDLTAFSKYQVTGSDAHSFLDRVSSGRIPSVDGRIALNYVLTDQGRIETEITVTKLAEDRFYVISGAMGEQRDLDWLVQHIGDDEDVTIDDLSTEYGVIVLVGPKARDVLSACTDADVSNEAFPFLRCQEIDVAGTSVRALRVGFTGSLGWELHMPLDHMGGVYDALLEAGAEHGIADFGSHALNSLRMEKAYLTRNELTHDIGPAQAGVGYFVKADKGEFVGRDHLGDAPSGNPWKLVYLDVDAADADCLGGEGVFAGDVAIGLTTSGGYGFTVDKSLAFAYVHADHAEPGAELGVLILGEMRSATVLSEPVYDPDNVALRA